MSTVAVAGPSSPSLSTPQPRQSEKNEQEQETVLQQKAEVFRRLHPRAYLERFLAEGVRPDARSARDFREVSINAGSIGTADGSALVRLGDTTVVCGVKAEIALPELDEPNQGFLVPNLDLPALCSPRFKPGPPSDDTQILSSRLYDSLISSQILDLESLVIAPGKAVWTLYVDATCINYDGNVLDAAFLAMVSALRNTRLPKATFDEETGRTTCTRREVAGLRMKRVPAAFTFGIFDSTHLLADPTSFEEPLLETSVTVVVDESEHVLSVIQEGVGLGENVVRECLEVAKRRRRGIQM